MTAGEPPESRLMFKATNWDTFTKHLERSYNVDIPNDRNQDENEIDTFIEAINEKITEAIKSKVPRMKSTGNTQRYVTKKTIQLEKRKSALLTTLNRRLKIDPRSRTTETKSIKLLLAQTKGELNLEFGKAIEKHWTNVFKKINFRDSEKFMPTVNRIFRPKPKQGLADIHIPEDHATILTSSGNDLANSPLVNKKIHIYQHNE